MNTKQKLQLKMSKRIGAVAFNKSTYQKGIIHDFVIVDNGVYYMLAIDVGEGIRVLEKVHESDIVIMKDSVRQ